MVRTIQKVMGSWQTITPDGRFNRDNLNEHVQELEFSIQRLGQRDAVEYAIWREAGTLQHPGRIVFKIMLRDLQELLERSE